MKKTLTSITDTALSIAEDAAGLAVEAVSDVATDAADIAGDLAIPALAYGSKKLVSTRLAVFALMAGGLVIGVLTWQKNRKQGSEEETVVDSIPNMDSRNPA